MKFKFKLKLYKYNNKKNKNKKIFGNFILNNKIYNVYILKNNFLRKIFKNNFLIIFFLKNKYFTYIKNLKIKYINNEIEFFILKEINNNFYINYNCIGNKISKKIIFINNGLFPRNIYLTIVNKKKIIKDSDFFFKNFKINKKILFKFKI